MNFRQKYLTLSGSISGVVANLVTYVSDLRPWRWWTFLSVHKSRFTAAYLVIYFLDSIIQQRTNFTQFLKTPPLSHAKPGINLHMLRNHTILAESQNLFLALLLWITLTEKVWFFPYLSHLIWISLYEKHVFINVIISFFF